MFGQILSFENSKIYVKNMEGNLDTNYIGYHVVFPEVEHKIVGEIVNIDSDKITIQLVGEIVNDKFISGVLKKPSIKTTPRIILKSELENILGSQNYLDKNTLLFGTSPIYKDYLITSPLNEFFGSNFAIIGNPLSGKSCGLARLLQNVFYSNPETLPKNAHMVIFDTYGEYKDTFNDMDRFSGLHYKKYTTQQVFGNSELFTYPAWFLSAEDLAFMLDVDSNKEIPTLDQALKLVKIFKSNDTKINEYKDNLIARTCLDILSSNKAGSQISEQLTTLLSTYNTPTLNLNSQIKQEGYDRTLKQCLNVDSDGELNSLSLLVNLFQQSIKENNEDIEVNNNITYTLKDIYYALDFILIKDGSFDNKNILKLRLKSIVDSDEANLFEYSNYISKEEYVHQFFATSDGIDNAQLVNVNLSYLNDNYEKYMVTLCSKLLFEYTKTQEVRGSYPIHIILEDANKYINNDIFDKIINEGNKYGTIFGLITQRPNEIKSLSLCSNFIVFKLSNNNHLNTIKDISSNITDEYIERIKTLHPGVGVVFGRAFNLPLLVNFPIPNQAPKSSSINIDSSWYNETDIKTIEKQPEFNTRENNEEL